MELNKIYNEDCLVGMERIPDGSVDMILCDLPYGTTACSWDAIIPFEPLWEQYERVIKDSGAVVLFGSEPFSSELRMSNIDLYKYDWYWKKSKAQGFLNAKRMPLKDIETISVFYKKLPTYNPQGTILVNKEIINPKGKREKGRHVSGQNGGVFAEKKYTRTHTNYPRQVLNFGIEGKPLHPTQKPVSLFEYLIKTYTNENETVLDNCMGSGTTAIACINTERNFIGFELDGTYYKKSLERIENHKTQTDIFDVLEGN